MNIGIMGGSFNPIHCGHLLAAESAREGMGLDEIWFMPSNVPPHKRLTAGAGSNQRLAMVGLAVEAYPEYKVEDIELRKGGVSYSIETVLLLKRQYPGHIFHYIIGADMVNYLPKWHRIEELVRLVSFIGLQRAGVNLDLEGLPGFIRERVTLVQMPVIEISSSDIRNRIRRGKSIRFLVPGKVEEYIEENGLYGP